MINVYTDGSCNLKLQKAGIGIYFCNKEISKSINRPKVTNNIAELCAIIEAFKYLKIPLSEKIKIVIHTDSNYAILCATTYGEKCARKIGHLLFQMLIWSKLYIPNFSNMIMFLSNISRPIQINKMLILWEMQKQIYLLEKEWKCKIDF